MVETKKYIDFCEGARIAVLYSEKKILREIDQDGWFEPELYLKRMKEAHLPVTNNMRMILEWMRQDTDEAFIGEEKEIVLKARLIVIGKQNKLGDQKRFGKINYRD